MAAKEGEEAAASYYGNRGVHWDIPDADTPAPKASPQQFQRLYDVLRFSSDSGAGQAVRRVAWSLWTNRLACDTFTGCPSVNLWGCLSAMDEVTRLEIAQLIAMSAEDREAELRRLLRESGEWERVDTLPAFEVAPETSTMDNPA